MLILRRDVQVRYRVVRVTVYTGLGKGIAGTTAFRQARFVDGEIAALIFVYVSPRTTAPLLCSNVSALCYQCVQGSVFKIYDVARSAYLFISEFRLTAAIRAYFRTKQVLDEQPSRSGGKSSKDTIRQ